MFSSRVKRLLILSNVCNMYKHRYIPNRYAPVSPYTRAYIRASQWHRVPFTDWSVFCVCSRCVCCGNREEDKFNGWASSSFTLLLSLYLTLLLVSLLFLPSSLHFFLIVGRTFVLWRDWPSTLPRVYERSEIIWLMSRSKHWSYFWS